MDAPDPSGRSGSALTLEPRAFRNLADEPVLLGEGLTVLHGPNGAGKTNLLEATYFALTGASFRPGSDRDAIRFGERTARVELEIASNPPLSLFASLDRGGERRRSSSGGGEPLSRRPLVSVFLPDRLALVKGVPALRRAHLDRFSGAMWPARAELRTRFGRALSQRNALVSRIRGGLSSPASLETWDRRLAAEAMPLIASRREAGELLSGPYAALGTALGLAGASIAYRPRFEGDEEELAGKLGELRSTDLGRAYTGFGPQADEFEFRLGDRQLRRFGSQGQQRAALLALLLAEWQSLVAVDRSAPLLLLDDVMSELDPERRALLVETVSGCGQAIITATEPGHVPDAPGMTRLPVVGGSTGGLAVAA